MKLSAKYIMLLTGVAIFIGLPVLIYAMSDVPRRSLLKEALSILTLVAFSLMLAQFFMTRGNEKLLQLFKPPQVQKVHKYIAYGAMSVIILHPFLVVLPRYFEAGVKPWDAFVTMITTFDNLGLLAGMAAWVLLVVVAVTAYFRRRLIPHMRKKYRGWRYTHGGLVVVFTVLGLWHAIALGRHTNTPMTAFYLTVALIGFGLLAKLYWGTAPASPKPVTPPEGQQA